MSAFIKAAGWLRDLVRSTIRPRPRLKIWEWADRHVVIPEESGGPHPGRFRSSRFPIWRGLFELAGLSTTRSLALCASARVGKTLFSVIVLLYWIGEKTNAVVWLDPSAASARKFVRSELDHFFRLCSAVWALAIVTRERWNTFWKSFRGKIMRIVGSGAEADLHGFNAELAILNERDRLRDATSDDAGSADKIVARTRLFPYTRLVLENSTPGVGGEFSPIWQAFLRGTQHHCFLPCPHCSAKRKAEREAAGLPLATVLETPVGWARESMDPDLAGWQRLTFSAEKRLVPFDLELRPLLRADGKLLAREQWREETTGRIRFEQFAIYAEQRSKHDATKFERVRIGYDMDALERGATYQCSHCGGDIEHRSLRWMLARFRWVSLNPEAPKDRVSAHVWAALSPFEFWGLLAREFLEAKGNLAALVKFHNFSLGLPYIRAGSAVKSDDLDRVIARTPVRYVKGQLPMLPVLLTITVDVQPTEFWYCIRAHGLLEGHPDLPTWSALVDWGRAFSWDELLEQAGLKPAQRDGSLRRFIFTDSAGTAHEFHAVAGLVDSGGDAAERVYTFCAHHAAVFSPYKGASIYDTRGNKIRVTKAMDEQLDLLLCWSDFFCENLYSDCIKIGTVFGKPVHWWLPTDLDRDYRKQLCDEYKSAEGWKTRTKTNHLGDCEKMQRVLSDKIEEMLDNLRAERRSKTENEARS